MRSIFTRILLSDFKSFLHKSFYTLHNNQPFLDNWHIHLISRYLEAIESGEIKRLIINIPPRSLKSICVNVAWPAWILAKNSTKKIICASYSNALSIKHGLDCKKIMTSDWYTNAFSSAKLIKGQNNKSKFVTADGGFRLSTSIGGTLTGEGADFLIVDDPLTPMQALSNSLRKRANTWFEQTFASRLNDQRKGAIIIVMQRLHVQDLSGFLLKKDVDEWVLLNLPLIAEKDQKIVFDDFIHYRKQGDYLHNVRYGEKEIDNLKKSLGSYAFSAQYQQNPVTQGGGIIKRNWLHYYEQAPKFESIYQSWDCAIKTGSTNDYSACTTWGVLDGKYYLIDVLKKRLDYPSLKKEILAHAALFESNVIIVEDKASGQQIIQELSSSGLSIIKYSPKFDKVTRLIISSNIFEAGRVILQANKQNIEEFINELTAFPNSDHDDQVDSATQFLDWFERKQKHINHHLIRRL